MAVMHPVGGGTGDDVAGRGWIGRWWPDALLVAAIATAAAAGVWLVLHAARPAPAPAPDPRIATLQTKVADLADRVAHQAPPAAGRPGRDATPAQVAGEVARQAAAYLREHPPVTAADVAAAVARYAAAHPPAQGTQGKPGPAPASITLTVAGVTQTCVKIPVSPAAAPRYSCQPVH